MSSLTRVDIWYRCVDVQRHRQASGITAGRILVPLLLVEGSLPQFAVVWGEREIADQVDAFRLDFLGLVWIVRADCVVPRIR